MLTPNSPVEWEELDGSRLDTWVRTGSIVSSHYDPLLAKMMFHASTREEAVTGIHKLLTASRICGPPTNLDFLASIIADGTFKIGDTMTKFLGDFKYAPSAIDVISGGAYTTIQDYPGRPNMGRGFPHSGPMDPLAFRIANLLVGNPAGKEGLEITLDGPELLFLGPAVVAICGAPMDVKLDGQALPMWVRINGRSFRSIVFLFQILVGVTSHVFGVTCLRDISLNSTLAQDSKY